MLHLLSRTSSNNISSNNEENITIKIKNYLDSKVHEITINKNDTVLALKGEIQKKTQIPPGLQYLISNGRKMKDSDPITTYELNNNSSITMIKVENEQQSDNEALNIMLNNPEMWNELLNSPQFQRLFQNNPQNREFLQSPFGRQLLLQELNAQVRGFGSNSSSGSNELRPSSSTNTNSTTTTENGGLGVPYMNPQPVYQQFPQPDPNVDYKEKYKDQIAQIKEMGIDDEEKIIDALKKCDGNVQ